MRIKISSVLMRYGMSVVSVALASAAALLIWALVKPLSAPLFLAAVIITAWRGGKGPALLATILSTLILDYFFIAPLYHLGGSWEESGRLIVFATECVLLSWLIDSRRQVEIEVRASREQLRSLSGHLQSMLEEERTRIAREIHDELGQSLTGLKFDVFWLRDQIVKDSDRCGNKLLLMKLESILEAIDTTIYSVRKIARELRPAVLDTLGLTAAIEWQVEDFEKRSGLKCQFNSRLEDIPLDPEISTALFRIFQESLTNIARHAAATNVEIKLESENGHLLLQLKDNGKGIEESRIAGANSFGILGMQERVLLLNGKLNVSGVTGIGTIVAVRIPFLDSIDGKRSGSSL